MPTPTVRSSPLRAPASSDAHSTNGSDRRRRTTSGPEAETPVDLTVGQIDLRTLFRVALPVSLAFFTALLLGGVLMWITAGVTGVLGGFEELLADASGARNYDLPGLAILLVAAFMAVVASLVTATISVLVAAAYNRIIDTTGGVTVVAHFHGSDAHVEGVGSANER